MMFTCRTYSGREALDMGLANACVADSEFDSAIQALTAEIPANSSFSHAANKRLLIETDGLPQPAGLAHEITAAPAGAPTWPNGSPPSPARPPENSGRPVWLAALVNWIERPVSTAAFNSRLVGEVAGSSPAAAPHFNERRIDRHLAVKA